MADTAAPSGRRPENRPVLSRGGDGGPLLSLQSSAERVRLWNESVRHGPSRGRLLERGVGLVVTSVAVWLFLSGVLRPDAPRGLPAVGLVVLAVALVGLYGVAYRTELASEAFSAVPTQPVLVGMLLLLPTWAVPATVLIGLCVGAAGSDERPRRLDRLVLRATNGAHCLGPVAVLLLAGDGSPDLSRWPVYLLALLSQVVLDSTLMLLLGLGDGASPGQLLVPMAWTTVVDVMLAVIALCLVIAADDVGSPTVALALLVVPVALVRLLSRDRRAQLDQAVGMSGELAGVREEARLDPLTGLTNRRGWREHLAEVETLVRERPDTVVRVLVADLDGLKRVNDDVGHEAGDDLITAMAAALRSAVPEARAVARLGGDEFGLLVVAQDGCSQPSDDLVDRVRRAVGDCGPVAGASLSASLGQASFPPAATLVDAVALADARARQDKVERGAGRVSTTTPTMAAGSGNQYPTA